MGPFVLHVVDPIAKNFCKVGAYKNTKRIYQKKVSLRFYAKK